jgi:hypothetical protein
VQSECGDEPVFQAHEDTPSLYRPGGMSAMKAKKGGDSPPFLIYSYKQDLPEKGQTDPDSLCTRQGFELFKISCSKLGIEVCMIAFQVNPPSFLIG